MIPLMEKEGEKYRSGLCDDLQDADGFRLPNYFFDEKLWSL